MPLREPLNDEIHAVLIKQGKEAGFNSLESTAADIASNDKASGWRVSEYSQTRFDSVDYHEYPSGRKNIIAVNGKHVIF